MAAKCKMFVGITEHFMGISLVLCMEYISDHRHERTNIAAKYKIFMNCNKNVKKHLPKI